MDARGFNAAELIVVLGLTGVLGSLALWHAIQWQPDLRLDAAARQVMLDLRQARGRAMAEQRQRRLLVSVSSDTYVRQYRVGAVYEDDGATISLPPAIDVADCTAAGGALAFTPRGTASSFGSVVLRNARGRERRVVVDIVGRVRVQ